MRLNSLWHQSQRLKQWENNKTWNIISIHKSNCTVRSMAHFKSYDFPGKVPKKRTFKNYSEQPLGIQPHWQNEKYWVKSLRVTPHSWRSKGRVFSKDSEWHILLNSNTVMKKAKRKLPSSRRKWSHSIFFKTINIFCLIRECLRANVFTVVNSVLHSLFFAFFFPFFLLYIVF